jgi:hypothetical protein
VLIFSHRTNEATGQRVNKHHILVPTTPRSNRGRLRLAREGSVLIASVAEGDQEQFQEIHRSEIDTADPRMVRFAGLTGGDPNARLDARLLQFQLQWQDPASSAEVPQSSGRRGSLVWAMIVILVVLGVCFVLLWMRRRPATRAPQQPAAAGKAAGPPAGKTLPAGDKPKPAARPDNPRSRPG